MTDIKSRPRSTTWRPARAAPHDRNGFGRQNDVFALSPRDVLTRVFERVVEACIAAGLVGGEGFAV